MKMQKHYVNRGIGSALLVACTAWVASAALVAFQKAKPEDFSGNWQLNESASTNPGGPAAGVAAPRSGGGGGSKSGGGGGGGSTSGDKLVGGVTGGGAKTVDTQFSKEEQDRTLACLKLMQAVPQKLTIAASTKDFNLTYEGGGSQPVTFPNTADGKKTKVTAVPAFEKLKIEAKAQWNNGIFKRELTTPDSLTVNEEYTLSADGKQLTVVLTAKSGMWRIPEAMNPPIKRVYDKIQ
jgi:hypothetical protein